MSKRTGLAAFTKRNTKAAAAEKLARGKKAQGDLVALTVPIPKTEWTRLHQLAMSEGISLQNLALDGTSTVFAKLGLPPIDW